MNLEPFTLEDKVDLLLLGVMHGQEHLTTMYGDFNENLKSVNMESKEFLFGHLTGMMEILRQLMPPDEEE